MFYTHLYIRAFPYIPRVINMAHLNFLSNVVSKKNIHDNTEMRKRKKERKKDT